MAEAAGIINKYGPKDDGVFREILANAAPEVHEHAQAVRQLVYDVLPETVEVVCPKQGSVGWGTEPKKFTEQFAYLTPFKRHRHPRLLLRRRAARPSRSTADRRRAPSFGRLAMRSMKITSLEQVRQPALRVLLQEHAQHEVPAPASEKRTHQLRGRASRALQRAQPALLEAGDNAPHGD